MSDAPKVIDLVVNNDLCIGCGICISYCPNKALNMHWNQYGFLVPQLQGTCHADGSCIEVCPFNPYPKKEIETESELSNIFFSGEQRSNSKVGKYINIYAGFSAQYRMTSSSGGIATYVLSKLFQSGLISHVISVRYSSDAENAFEYAIVSKEEELLSSSKTRYYPVTLATVFSKIKELEGKVAIVGVACFIKAIRLAQYADPIMKEKIVFLVGIICGGVKSKFFTEYLSSLANKDFNKARNFEYRIKDLDSTAADYSFGCSVRDEEKLHTLKMQSVGDMWGTGFFKANACDFCDDVTTELADISLGDAWITPYILDGKGTNLIVTRTSLAEEIITQGLELKELQVEALSLEKFIASQQGSFNHRRKGLTLRIKLARKKKTIIPPKRLHLCEPISIDFKIVQMIRLRIRKQSLIRWNNSKDAKKFNRAMKMELLALKLFTNVNHFVRNMIKKIKH
jgi:coenzyme F420-reducing hydrogenase beta subunit